MNSLAQGRACTPQCSAIGAINFSGNITPNTWYQRLRFPGGKKRQGKVHLPAVVILAEIVWWYRPMEKRDEQTGASLGFFRKFHGDKLQLSYQAMADKLGLTKRQASDACKYLEREGYIDLEFRTIHSNGMVLNNVLFIDVDPEAINDLTHSDPITFERGRVLRLNGRGVALKRGTNTEINSEITTEITESNKRLASQNAARPFLDDSWQANQGGEVEQHHSSGQQKDQRPKTPDSGSKTNSSAAAPRKFWKPEDGLKRDRSGWVLLPATDTAHPEDRSTLRQAKAIAVRATQMWLIEQGIRDIEIEEGDRDGQEVVNHLHGAEPLDQALSKGGGLTLRLLRNVAVFYDCVTAAEFNEVLEECFWDAWDDVLRNAA